jgi:hypothetical protein
LIGARQVEADTPEVLEGSLGLREHNYGRVLQTRGRPKWRKSYHVYVIMFLSLVDWHEKNVNHV